MSSPVFKQLLNKAKFTRIRKFSKPHMYYSDSCGRGINHSGERFQNKAVSGTGFNFFRVGGRPILVKKKYVVSKTSGFVRRWPVALAKRRSFHETNQTKTVKVMKSWRLDQLSSPKWNWVVQHVLNVWIQRLEIVSGTNVDLQIRQTKLINLKLLW